MTPTRKSKPAKDTDLCDEDNGRLGLAYAAPAIVADEAEAGDAGGANVPVAALPVGHPLKGFGAHRTRVVHYPPRLVSIDGHWIAPSGGDRIYGSLPRVCSR